MRKMTALSGPLLAICLPGCGEDVVVKPVPVPPQFLSCKAEPATPAETTDKSVANFIIDLVEAGADCRSKVRAIRDWSAKLETAQ